MPNGPATRPQRLSAFSPLTGGRSKRFTIAPIDCAAINAVENVCGCVVALVPSQAVADAVLEAWRTKGLEGFATSAAPEARLRDAPSETAP